MQFEAPDPEQVRQVESHSVDVGLGLSKKTGEKGKKTLTMANTVLVVKIRKRASGRAAGPTIQDQIAYAGVTASLGGTVTSLAIR